MSDERRDLVGTGAHDAVAAAVLEHFLSVKGEGDDWDFKQVISLEGAARVELARDAMAFGNHRGGGWLIGGVTSEYEYPGLPESFGLDTTRIANAVQRYIDGDFTVVAAEHLVAPPGSEEPKRFGIIHFGRRSRQPLVAARDGVAETRGRPQEFFRTGDIFVRRGAQSIRANSGDLRLLLETAAVDEARVQGVNRAWAAVVDVRTVLAHLEFVYDIVTVDEYPVVLSNPNLAPGFERVDLASVMDYVAQLQGQLRLERPHIGDRLYGLCWTYSAFCGRLMYKALENRDAGQFLAWGRNSDGADDRSELARLSQILPAQRVSQLWQGGANRRPLRPILDEIEQVVLAETRRVLSGWT